MKKWILLLALAIGSLSLAAQGYSLQTIYESNVIPAFSPFFVNSDEQKIWAIAGNQMVIIENDQPVFLDVSRGTIISELRKNDGEYLFVSYEQSYLCKWDSGDMSFDKAYFPNNFIQQIFCYQEDKIYICTEDKFYKEYVVYLWDGNYDFEKILYFPLSSGIYFRDMHVKSESHITLLSGGKYNSLFRFDGDAVSELCDFSHLLDLEADERTIGLYSVDGEKFFIRTDKGKFIMWDDNSGEVSLVYTLPEYENCYLGRTFMKNNDEVFIFGNGVYLLSMKNGTKEIVRPITEDENSSHYIAAFYEKESGQMYFSSHKYRGAAKIYRLTTGPTALNSVTSDLSIQYKGGGVYLVENPSLEKSLLSIYNISGVKVKNVSLESQVEIDLSVLPAGVYIFTIQTPAGLVSRKILKP